MKRKAAKRPALGRKEKVLTEAQLKKIAAGVVFRVMPEAKEDVQLGPDGKPWRFLTITI